MKTKKTLLIIALAISGLLIFSSFLTQQTQNKYLTVKSIECWSGLSDSYIIVIDENGKTEQIELEKLRPRNIAANAIKLHEIVNKTGSKGYDLVSTSSTGDQVFVINTYLFLKK